MYVKALDNINIFRIFVYCFFGKTEVWSPRLQRLGNHPSFFLLNYVNVLDI